jgi:hypothetical protein
MVAAMKKLALMVIGTAMQTYGEKLSGEQEVLMASADILIDVFAAESALLRAEAAGAGTRGDLPLAAARVFANDATGRVELAARAALAGMTSGDTLRTLLAAMRRVLRVPPIDTVALRRTVADATVAARAYPF